ncbi:metalloendopeptidase OMA1, mitochondrial isoform X2 [Harpegnathos saltator]|uniref:metalloendopeptidase OMA1, mitochondrial isoform X2 n=1 Tax=Harpegnathos saltator TaxID=610380 RepID=UPI00058D3C50|nr:metalloendopeptidase OMA1, mitochondrial isoform X2 [Harpegnathos saltator]
MLSILRNSCRRNVRLSTNYLVIRSVGSHHLQTWSCRELLAKKKFDSEQLQYLKLQKCDFRTTQCLYVPPFMVYILRPVIYIGGALMGRHIKKWWARKSKEEKEKYRRWYRERRNVFLGGFGLYGLTLFIYYITHLKTDPLTQRSRCIIFNKKQERDLGNILYEFNNIVPNNHPASKRILPVFRRLIVANRDLKSIREIKWDIIVINTPLMNSFTLPDGKIFISLDMLKYVENDDQLGFVLAHEMAHSLLSHIIELLTDQFFLDFLIVVPTLLVWVVFPDMAAAIVQLLINQIMRIMYELPYSRLLEKEADEVAMKLAAKACIDVREAVVFLATLRKLTEMNFLSPQTPWISSHPSHDDREKNMNDVVTKVLETREHSGCPALPAVDPRTRFYGRSTTEQIIHFRQRGIIE